MNYKLTISMLATLVLIVPMLQASCLTSIEVTSIRNVAINSSVNPDVFQNIFEELCNQAYLNTILNNFNSSMQSQMTTLNNQVQTTLNNSALVQSLNQVAMIYNATVLNLNATNNINNLIAQSEARQNAKIDNETLDVLNQIKTFEDSVNQQLVDKQTNNLSTNRIIMIVLGLAVLGGAFWYFSRKKVSAIHSVNPLPYDLDSFHNDKNSNNAVQAKRKPTGKT